MKIEQYDSGLLHSNMYVVSENGHAVVIDPALYTEPARDLEIDWILLTHEHYDHISGVNAWKEKTHGKVLCSAACAERIRNPNKNLARLFPEFCQLQTWIDHYEVPDTDRGYRCSADETFTDETRFIWQGHLVRLQEIPGHSPGSIGIFFDRDCFFSGDSLLKNREIELRFPGGSREQWARTGLARIEAVPKGTIIYPGHFEKYKLTEH